MQASRVIFVVLLTLIALFVIPKPIFAAVGDVSCQNLNISPKSGDPNTTFTVTADNCTIAVLDSDGVEKKQPFGGFYQLVAVDPNGFELVSNKINTPQSWETQEFQISLTGLEITGQWTLKLRFNDDAGTIIDIPPFQSISITGGKDPGEVPPEPTKSCGDLCTNGADCQYCPAECPANDRGDGFGPVCGCGAYGEQCCGPGNTCQEGILCEGEGTNAYCTFRCGYIGDSCCAGNSCEEGRCNPEGQCIDFPADDCSFRDLLVKKTGDGQWRVSAKLDLFGWNTKDYAISMHIWGDPGIVYDTGWFYRGTELTEAAEKGGYEGLEIGFGVDLSEPDLPWDRVRNRHAEFYLHPAGLDKKICTFAAYLDDDKKVGDTWGGIYVGSEGLFEPCRVEDGKIVSGGSIATAIGCIPLNILGISSRFIAFGMGLGGGVTLVLIAFASFRIMTSQGDPKQLEEGRELLTSALLGLIMIVLSAFLLRVMGVNILGLF